MKNTLEGFNSRLDEAEDQISKVEDKVAENTQTEQQKEKKNFKNEDSINLWDNMKGNSIRIIGVSEGRRKEQGIENPF